MGFQDTPTSMCCVDVSIKYKFWSMKLLYHYAGSYIPRSRYSGELLCVCTCLCVCMYMLSGVCFVLWCGVVWCGVVWCGVV